MSYPKPIKKPLAPWTKAFPKQARALRPEKGAAGGVKARSGSEAARMAVYVPIAAMFKKLHPICQCCDAINAHLSLEPICGATVDVHHFKGTQGLLRFDVRWFLATCRSCHEWLGRNIEEARELGLLAKTGDWNRQD